MSLILDALRKLDRQKSLHRKGTDDLAASILKLEPARPPKKWRLYLGAVSFTALVTAAVTYLAVVGIGSGGKSSPIPSTSLPFSGEKGPRTTQDFLKTSPPSPEKPSLAGKPAPPASPVPGPGVKSSPPSIAAPQASLPKSAAAPSSVTATPKPPANEPLPSSDPGRQVAISPSKPGGSIEPSSVAPEPPLKKSPPSPPDSLAREAVREVQGAKTQGPSRKETQPGTKAPASAADEKIGERKAIPEKVDRSTGVAKKPAETAANGPSSSPPRLKISGIVWHDDPDKRRAVINGTFAAEGSVIEGLKVVEILPARVRFLHQGRLLEISIFE